MKHDNSIYILVVDNIICGIFTIIDDVYKDFRRTLKEVPPSIFVSIVATKRNCRIVNVLKKGNVIEHEKGTLIC
jgi:hypothetical protein